MPVLLRACPCGCGSLVETGRCKASTKQAEKVRGSRHERGYTNDWARKSLQFRRAYPFCGMRPNGAPPVMSRCHDEGRLTEVLGTTNGRPNGQTDHVVPHKGDPLLFWDHSRPVEQQPNLQSLCTDCGTRKSMAGL